MWRTFLIVSSGLAIFVPGAVRDIVFLSTFAYLLSTTQFRHWRRDYDHIANCGSAGGREHSAKGYETRPHLFRRELGGRLRQPAEFFGCPSRHCDISAALPRLWG